MATKKSADNVDTTTTDAAPEAITAETTVAEPASAKRAKAMTVPAEATPAVVEPAVPSSAPEAVAETAPADQPVREVIVVDAPVPPRKRSNRLAGLGLAVLASIVFTALFAGAVVVIGLVSNGRPSISFLASPTFYWPVILFFIALALVITVVNTAGWWSYIITSVLVAAGVYFGSAALLLVSAGVLTMSQQEANAVYFAALANPITIAAALVAREVAIWTGAILGRRGRAVRLRNAEAREQFEREQAELIPTV